MANNEYKPDSVKDNQSNSFQADKDGNAARNVIINQDPGNPVPITIDPVTTPSARIYNVSAANTEDSFTIPSGVKRFTIKTRQNARLRVAFSAGDIASGDYFTLRPGVAWNEVSIELSSALTIYVESNKAGIDIEILEWT